MSASAPLLGERRLTSAMTATSGPLRTSRPRPGRSEGWTRVRSSLNGRAASRAARSMRTPSTIESRTVGMSAILRSGRFRPPVLYRPGLEAEPAFGGEDPQRVAVVQQDERGAVEGEGEDERHRRAGARREL